MLWKAALVISLIVLSSGCTGLQSSSETTLAEPMEFSSGVDCQQGPSPWVAFYGLGTPVEDRLWEPDTVAIGYTIPANTSAFFVVYEGEKILGTKHMETEQNGITGDGLQLPLESPLSGKHTIQVVFHKDVNRNGQFEPSIDEPCFDGSEVVQAGPSVIDFNQFD